MRTTYHHSNLSERRYSVLKKKADTYTLELNKISKSTEYNTPEASIALLNDKEYYASLKKVLARFTGHTHVVLIGIGGSSLGTEAIYNALAYVTSPILHILDSIDVQMMDRFESFVQSIEDPQEIVIVVASKSGVTTETILNVTKVVEICEKKYGTRYVERIIFISDEETEFLQFAEERKILTCTLPSCVGGRFSVFSAIGIVPLTLLGIDVESLLEGATSALTLPHLRDAAKSAIILAQMAEEGVHTVNFFIFHKRLTMCGFWYRQLLAESIGKEMTTHHASFQHQLLPVVSTSVDLHSMAQLYLSGYKHIYTHFLWYDEESLYHVPTTHWTIERVPFLKNKEYSKVNKIIFKGLLQSYDDQNLPYRITTLNECSAFHIGFLLQSLMIEVMFLAHLFDVNAFTQPSIESYKAYVRNHLQ